VAGFGGGGLRERLVGENHSALDGVGFESMHWAIEQALTVGADGQCLLHYC